MNQLSKLFYTGITAEMVVEAYCLLKKMSAARDVLGTLLKETPLEAEMKTMTAEQVTAKFQNQAAMAGKLLDFHLSDEDFLWTIKYS